jgi:hypothetical protein
MGRPSLDVKVTLTVWFAPATTETVPDPAGQLVGDGGRQPTDGIATTESSVPEMPPAPLKLLPLVPLPLPLVPVPAAPLTIPALVAEELYPQPETMSVENAPRSSVRKTVSISFSMRVIEQRRSERQRSYSLHRQCGINCVTQ